MVRSLSKERGAGSLRADCLGIAMSARCFVHCVLTPVVLSMFAVSAHYMPSEEKIHRALAVAVAAIGAFAILSGYRKHRRARVLWLMGAGLALIFAGAYWGDLLPSHGAEVMTTLAGSSLMIAAHLFNHTFCRKCRCAE